MVGLILIILIVILIIVGIGACVTDDTLVVAWTFTTAFILSIAFGISLTTITSTPHEAKPEDRGRVFVVDKVDRQGDVYIFTKEDATQVARSSGDVVVSDTYGAEATIQYGNEYYSWGNFWFGEDWAGDEKIYYTPSNKG